jgi:hypothetical protein
VNSALARDVRVRLDRQEDWAKARVLDAERTKVSDPRKLWRAVENLRSIQKRIAVLDQLQIPLRD